MQIGRFIFLNEQIIEMMSININRFIRVFFFQSNGKCILEHLIAQSTNYINYFHINL